MERLTFNIGRSRAASSAVLVRRGNAERGRIGAERFRMPIPADARGSGLSRLKKRTAVIRERFDADYLWMFAFTVLLFFRPQDQIRPLAMLHMSELTAI